MPALSMVQGPQRLRLREARGDTISDRVSGQKFRIGKAVLEALTCQTRTSTLAVAIEATTTSRTTARRGAVEVRHASSIHRHSCFTKSRKVGEHEDFSDASAAVFECAFSPFLH